MTMRNHFVWPDQRRRLLKQAGHMQDLESFTALSPSIRPLALPLLLAEHADFFDVFSSSDRHELAESLRHVAHFSPAIHLSPFTPNRRYLVGDLSRRADSVAGQLLAMSRSISALRPFDDHGKQEKAAACVVRFRELMLEHLAKQEVLKTAVRRRMSWARAIDGLVRKPPGTVLSFDSAELWPLDRVPPRWDRLHYGVRLLYALYAFATVREVCKFTVAPDDHVVDQLVAAGELADDVASFKKGATDRLRRLLKDHGVPADRHFLVAVAEGVGKDRLTGRVTGPVTPHLHGLVCIAKPDRNAVREAFAALARGSHGRSVKPSALRLEEFSTDDGEDWAKYLSHGFADHDFGCSAIYLSRSAKRAAAALYSADRSAFDDLILKPYLTQRELLRPLGRKPRHWTYRKVI